MPCPKRPLLVTLSFLLVASACKKPQAEVRGEPKSTARTRAAELPIDLSQREPKQTEAPLERRQSEARRPRTIETIEVPNDRKVLVVAGANTGRPIVYLHGMCGLARPDLEAWGASVSEHGIVLALEGDAICANASGGTTWTSDAAALDARISAAIEAVQSARTVPLVVEELVLIGESLGASRATTLAARFPARYRRLVLVGGPETPKPSSLRQAKAVALLAGEKERQDRMRRGADDLADAGVRAQFWQLEGAVHGEYGRSGAEAMNAAVAFVASAP